MTARLAERGHALADLEQIVVTHQHIDHLGLVEILVEHSGAEVAALGAAAERLASFDEDAERDDAFAVEVMLRNGIPEDVTVALRSVSRSFRGWGSHVTVTRAARGRRRSSSSATGGSKFCTAPATVLRTPSSGTPSGRS